jgi:small-conductance mechanosensitive channel
MNPSHITSFGSLTSLFDPLIHLLRSILGDGLTFQITLSVILFVLFFVLAKTISYLLKSIIKPIVIRSKTEVDDKILKIIEGSSYKLISLLGIYLALLAFRHGLDHVSVVTKLTLVQEYPALISILSVLDNLFFILLIIMFLIIASQIGVVILDWYAEKMNANENKDLSGSLFPLLKKVLKLLFALFALIIVLKKFNVDISAFVVSLGVGSLAIALAAQETISNMISGFIIMIDRPFRIGDRIKIGNEIHGDVVSIGIRSTRIIDFDKNYLIIPNNDIVKSRIINLTYPTTSTRVLIDLPVSYQSDIDKVKKIVLKVANEDPDTDKSEPPEIYILRFGEHALEFRLAVRTKDYLLSFALGCRLKETIFRRFQDENIDIAVPQRLIQIVNSDKQDNS